MVGFHSCWSSGYSKTTRLSHCKAPGEAEKQIPSQDTQQVFSIDSKHLVTRVYLQVTWTKDMTSKRDFLRRNYRYMTLKQEKTLQQQVKKNPQ